MAFTELISFAIPGIQIQICYVVLTIVLKILPEVLEWGLGSWVLIWKFPSINFPVDEVMYKTK